MNVFKAHFQKISPLLIESPAFLFFPYLVLYLLGWVLKLPIAAVEKSFWVIHFINFFVVLGLFAESRKKIWKLEWLFWGGLFILFWNRGAYLEYPSDPWDHFRRLMLWNDYSLISENPYKDRLPYFFGWTFLKYFEPIRQRTFLNFYSAFWQWLLCYQFARFFLKLGIERARLFPFVIATIVFFGSGMVSFRYYMLSGVPLGYIAYLSGTALFLTAPTNFNLKRFIQVFILSALMVTSHPETFIFLCISVAALFIHSFSFEKKPFKHFYVFLAVLYAFSLAGGHFLFQQKIFPFSHYPYSEIWTAQLSQFSTFRLWDLKSKIFETVAVHGLFALVCAPFLIRKQSRLVILSIFPVFLLLFPPVALVIVKIFHFDTAYRVLYAFPLSILLVLVIEKILDLFSLPSKYNPALASVLVLLIAVPYSYPWRGRLFFQIHRPKPLRTLVPLDATAEWFFKERKSMPRDCLILSDDLSAFSLYTHLGKRKIAFDRPAPYHFFKMEQLSVLWLQEQFVSSLMLGRTMCGILLARREEIPPPPYSIVSMESKLWPPQRGDLREYVSDKMATLLPTLLNRGWIKTQIPPFYDLYEPPYLEDLPEPIVQTAE